MNENSNVEVARDDICILVDYFNGHPIMFIGIGISVLTLSVCKILDNKYNGGNK